MSQQVPAKADAETRILEAVFLLGDDFRRALRWQGASPGRGKPHMYCRYTNQYCCCASHLVVSDSLLTPWAVAHQAPGIAMGFSRQECWSGLPFPSPGDLLPDPGIEPRSPALQADSLSFDL